MTCRMLRFLAVGLFLMTPSIILAQTLTLPKTFSLDFSAGDLHAVVTMLERQTGITATVRDSETPFHLVYVHLDEASVAKAIRTIALSAGAKVIVNTDGSYLFETLDAVDPLPYTQAQMPTPHVPLNVADLHWYTLPLHHAVASDLAKLMHWNQPSAPVYSFEKFLPHTRLSVLGLTASPPPRSPFPADPLPVNPVFLLNSDVSEGVVWVFANDRDNVLLVEATKEGFRQVHQIVKILDIAAHGMTATVSYISVSENISELKQVMASQTAPMAIISGPWAAQAWESQTRSGHTATTVKTLNESEGQKPLEWLIPGYRLTRPRFNSDNSLTLTVIPSIRLFPEKQTPPIHRGDIIAIKELGRADVTLIKVDY